VRDDCSFLYSDIDDCASNPCLNGATCTDKENSFSCICVQGFEGSRCETGTSQGAACLQRVSCYEWVRVKCCHSTPDRLPDVVCISGETNPLLFYREERLINY